MREIKFRAWIVESGFMSYRIFSDDSYRTIWACLDPIESGADGEFMVGEDAFVMQYTGLKDKNGKEIYEGDIVRLMDSLGEVAYDSEYSACYMVGDVPFSRLLEEPLEVIGNIHEISELLKGTD